MSSRNRKFSHLVVLGVGLLALALAPALMGAYSASGASAKDGRLAAIEASPNWKEGRFVNTLPQSDIDLAPIFMSWFRRPARTVPQVALPIVTRRGQDFATSPASGLRITWLGHSTLLVEIDGYRVLVDTVWAERASPFASAGPKRFHAAPLPLDQLPEIDAVVISHDHYDHLDHPTMVALRDWETVFVVPLGVGAHLERWGIPLERIVEMDWWDRYAVGKLEIVMTPARHASGRHFFDGNRTLWAGYAFLAPSQRVFFSGDTGMFPGIQEIGARLGPFDIAMIEVGAYAQSWADWHMGPEQAVEAHTLLGGEVLLPIHWGLFNLSTHGWTEPIERVLMAAEGKGVTVWSPRPGESLEVGRPLRNERWWPALPWRPAQEYPVVSTTPTLPSPSGGR